MHSATMRYSPILAALAAMAALTSCATQGVEQVAQDTYLITISTPVEQNRTAAELALSARRMDEVRRESSRRSHEFCARQRRRAVEVDSMMSIQSRGNPDEEIHISDAEWDAVLTVTFRCE
ncbi:hypothetical protein [Candidatus Viadribacter manganicus]|uniref:DUF4156 domain-containing protein n=1 Tax=Candidatus Viadribacter manganicus TaxID=1759059 RepID=A0A1B1AD55_9PROT|nr:hypothetical protein [Candidatus Viadribacter manganicus]ANP44484.1 hypothetical protein ATE48_00375 [Candidatus Viadribacter manganicus]